jgi:N-acetylmuramic acid 6-phosphate etherase
MTEDFDPRYADVDAWPSETVLAAMLEAQLAAVAAVRPALPAIAQAAEAVERRLATGNGRLVYVGAGTSGRIGCQDGAELPPTFDWPEDRVLLLLAGGETALARAVEGAEDDAEEARRRIADARVGPDDIVIGIAASGATPFTVAAISAARDAGALTIAVANVPRSLLLLAAEHGILCETGAEVIAGSTRMKAGTAQKIVLNLFSTLLMIRLGRVYRGMMVAMRPTNAKLKRRSVAMVAHLLDMRRQDAERWLVAAGGDIKRAVLMARGASSAEADRLLVATGQNLREALAALGQSLPKARLTSVG